MLKKFVASILILIFLGLIGIAIYFIYLYNSVTFIADKIIYYNPPQSARFFDNQGNLIGVRWSKENRFYVRYKDIPPKVIETLLATEDTLFFEHPGINLNAIVRALIKDIKAGKKVEGASTITQQLVRNIYLNRKKTLQRKLKEIIIALKIEHFLTKEQILERYLNQVYLGRGYYGIKTAAYGYFRKNLKDLTLKEIAMLIALPKGPSLYDPTRRYDLNLKRANKILKRLYKLGWITKDEFKDALIETPKVYKKMPYLFPYAIDTAIREFNRKDIFTRGYDIYLTINPDYQKLAKEAMKWNYKRVLNLKKELNESTLNGAMVTTKQETGEILAIVGGVDYSKSKFNRAVQSQRSVGSSIKPFIYQIALNAGYNPASLIPDISRTYKIENNKYWKPKNYEKDTLGLITLREALVHSRNLATINLVNSLGLNRVIKEMYNFGFENLPNNLSIALGSVGESVVKFSELYTIISNYGVKTKVHIIKKAYIPKDNMEIKFNYQPEYIEPPYQAYLMINILRDVVLKGTGKNANVKDIEIAGKTGTTNEFKDAWFCGFTPTTQTIVWFGRDNQKSMGRGMTGGRVSAPLLKYFYTNLIKIHPELVRKFPIPKGVHKFKYKGKEELFTKISPPPTQEKVVPIY